MPRDRILALQLEVESRRSRGKPTDYLERLIADEIDAEAQNYPECQGAPAGFWALTIASTLIIVICMIGAAYA